MLIVIQIATAETTVALWQGNKEGAVSLAFDDGVPSQFENAFPLLQQNGLKATFFIATNAFDPNSVERVVADGQEIGSHSVSHPYLSELNTLDLETELSQSQLILQNLTGQDVAVIAYPYGDYDSDVIAAAADYYIAARTTDSNALNASSPGFYELEVIWPNEGGLSNVISYLRAWVELAVIENKWAIEIFHSIGLSEGYDNVPTEDLEAHINYLVSNEPNIWVAPMGTVIEYIYERDTALITTLISDSNGIQLDLNCGLDSLFNTPLTLLTDCPEGWETGTVIVKQGANEQIAELVSMNNGLYLMFTAIPDTGIIELSPRHVISGYCIEPDGFTPVMGVLLQSVDDVNTVSDANGYYEIWVDRGWTGDIQAHKDGYIFDPNSYNYVNITGNDANANFTVINKFDLDWNGSIGFGDLHVFAFDWLKGPDRQSDFYKDEDDIVNFLDFAEFSKYWLTE